MLREFPKYIGYSDLLEISISKIMSLLTEDYRISRRMIALLLIQEDEEILQIVKENKNFKEIRNIIDETKSHYSVPISFLINTTLQKEVERMTAHVMHTKGEKILRFRDRLGQLMMDPILAAPVLVAVLYYGLYKFVGRIGAGVLVDFLENKIFLTYVNPFIIKWVQKIIPFLSFQDLFIGEYGIFTLGLRYACAIILPIVATFFFAFSIIEDTGYLPRLAMLVDRLFKKIGLSGRAVIPLVLGFGCDTMATMVTRTLPTKRERIIATLLLALAVPCSAQMGVIIALLDRNPLGLMIWLGVIISIFLIVGVFASKIMPGELPSFYMEIPPLRLPRLSNIMRKTLTRLKWYFFEVLPLFIFASILIWVGQIIGIFKIFIEALSYPVQWIGLPKNAAIAFLFGFFRRDYGAAGLYDLKKAGFLSGNQIVISCIVLTLFLPCIAQLLMNIKERGMRTGILMSIFILFFSFTVGYIVNIVLTLFAIQL